MTIGNGCGRKRRPVHVRQAAEAGFAPLSFALPKGRVVGRFHIGSAGPVAAGALYFVKGAAAANSINNSTMPAIYANASATTFSAEKPARCDSDVVITVTTASMPERERRGVTEMSSFCYFCRCPDHSCVGIIPKRSG